MLDVPDKVNVPVPAFVIPPVPVIDPEYSDEVLLESPIVSVKLERFVVPEPVRESIVLDAPIVNVPLFNTPELVAMFPDRDNVPAVIVVAPV